MSAAAVPLLVREQRWYCPNCRTEDVTVQPLPHTRMHACRALYGLIAPMLPAGVRAKVEARLREDYVGREQVQLDGRGLPVMSVVTTRDDGQDAIVFAPPAVARARME